MIPAETIEEIKQKADLITIISSYVPLKKKGKNFLGLCPFHQEKTPSFTVSPDKDLWHCFGCGAGGNLFSFVMKIENMSFAESVKEVGEKVGITVREEMTANYKHKKEKKDLLYTVCQKASEFFQAQLLSDNGKIARDYLEERGVPKEFIEEFKLGYATPVWDSLLKRLTDSGYSPELLEQAGLVVKREDGSGYYDRFRGRLLFTVTDNRNQSIAFGGRILVDNKNEPKYLNSPETPIFNKGKGLYALPQAMELMRQSKTVILTEGYMDTITCHQFGFKNTVATLGTALTIDQAKLLARYVKTVILAYDADQAGQMATERGIDILRSADLEIKVALLKGKDPDEMLRGEGKDAFLLAVNNALPYIRYLLDRIIEKQDTSSPEGKDRAARAAVELLKTVSQDVLRSEYIHYVAETLKIKEDVLLALLSQASLRQGFGGQSKRRETPWVVRPSSKQEKAQNTLLKAALDDIEVREHLKEEVKAEDLEGEISQKLFTEIMEHSGVQGLNWLENIGDEKVQKLARQLALMEEPWTERTLQDCILVVEDYHSRQQKTLIRQKIQEAEARGDEAEARELLAALRENI